MNFRREIQAYVDEAGRLVIPAEAMLEYGLKPGSQIRIEKKAAGLSLRTPVSHLRYGRSLRRYEVGNVTRQDLCDLWDLPEYLSFRERIQKFDFSPCTFCGGCDLLEKNEEDCFGNPFPTCGGCLWAQTVIQCP